jgi:uncharacterized membrane protein HdeD (DUF308 family)
MGTVLGMTIVILGILAMMAPMISGLAVTVVVAALLLAAGVAMSIYAFSAGSFWRGLLQFLFGGITALAGVVLFARPLLGLASITMVLAVYFLVDGIAAIVLGFRAKPIKGWGWMVFSGIAAIVLSVLIWREWPASGQWAVGILVGVRLVMSGWAMMMLGGLGEAAADVVDEAAGQPR